jgi:PTH1 family peptidyl-tRNA hydrolase
MLTAKKPFIPVVIFRDRNFIGGLVLMFVMGIILLASSALISPYLQNLSGRSVQAAKAFFKVQTDDLVVVHDELDLPFGQIRLKAGGGDAGHNGLRSISEVIGPDYARLRIGVGRPPPEFRGSGADFVLQALAPAEQADVENVIGRAVEAVSLLIDAGLSRAMNQTNQRTVR